MRKVNKEKKKLEVTKKDLYSNIEGTPMYEFSRMAYTEMYEFRIRKYLYETGKISPKGFLFNKDVLTLPGLAIKNKDGEVLIDSHITGLFARFSLSQEIFNSGNELLSLLVDTDDALYAVMTSKQVDQASSEDVFSNEDVIKEVNKAFDRLSHVLLNFEINNYILGDEVLDELSMPKV